MKNSLYILTLGLLLGTLFLTACQSDALPNEDNGKPVVSCTDSCYLNLQIVNNTKPTTRATIAATAAENAVYDGILCIFEGPDEVTATLKTAVAIDQLIKNPGSTDNPQTMNITQRLAYGTISMSSPCSIQPLRDSALAAPTKTYFTTKMPPRPAAPSARYNH